MLRARSPRRASILALALLAILVAGVLGLALLQRCVRSGATAAWSRDHLALRLLAGSAAEELYFQVSRQANDPASPLFAALRTLAPVGGAVAALPGLTLTHAQAQAAAAGRAHAALAEVRATAGLRALPGAATGDGLERVAVIVFDAVATFTRRGSLTTERTRVTRTLRIGRTAPPRAFDGTGLVVARTTAGDLAAFEGRAAYTLAGGRVSTLRQLLTRPRPLGFLAPTPGAGIALWHGFLELDPAALEARAHHVVRDASALRGLFAARSGVHGVLHLSSDEPLQLAFPAFRGRCLISVAGPVEVGDIRMADAQSELTIVSADRIVVSGRRVEANLLCPGSVVAFASPAHVRGAVATLDFPRGHGVTPDELGEVAFERARTTGSRLASYAAGVSPYPLLVEHARDREEWVAW